MNRNYKNTKKTIKNTSNKIQKEHLIVCEDFENESD